MQEQMAHSEGKGLRSMVKFAHDTLKLYDDSHFITDKPFAFKSFIEHYAAVMRNEGLDVDAEALKKEIIAYGEGNFGSYLADYI